MGDTLAKLQSLIMESRRNKNAWRLGKLQTVMGEATAIAKVDQRDVTSADVEVTLEKFIKNNHKTKKLLKTGSEQDMNLDGEIALFEGLLPTDPYDLMSLDDIHAEVVNHYAMGGTINNNGAMFGQIMKMSKGRFTVAEVREKLGI